MTCEYLCQRAVIPLSSCLVFCSFFFLKPHRPQKSSRPLTHRWIRARSMANHFASIPTIFNPASSATYWVFSLTDGLMIAVLFFCLSHSHFKPMSWCSCRSSQVLGLSNNTNLLLPSSLAGDYLPTAAFCSLFAPRTRTIHSAISLTHLSFLRTTCASAYIKGKMREYWRERKRSTIPTFRTLSSLGRYSGLDIHQWNSQLSHTPTIGPCCTMSENPSTFAMSSARHLFTWFLVNGIHISCIFFTHNIIFYSVCLHMIW